MPRLISSIVSLVVVLMLGVVRAAGGQELAAADAGRAPRFLLTSASKLVPLDVDRTPALARRLELSLDGVTLKLALAEIASRAGIRLAFSDNDVPLERRVHLRADAITVAAALTDVLLGTGLDVVFGRDGGVSLVKRPPPPPIGSIVGRVTNAQSGDPIEGVEVSLQRTRWRTLTGTEGQYRLANVDTGTYVLTARRIGYTRQSRSVTVVEGQETTADFALQAGVTTLGEVVVTAQKREERFQDVPLSIGVVTPEEIDRRGLVSAEDYLRGIPGAHQTTGQFGHAIIIRGIQSSLGSQNFGVGTTVATYFGETPTTSSAGLSGNSNVDAKLVDIERVEVLRGPQGTAFGNASLGGAVRTIPVAPKLDRFEGRVASTYSVTAGMGGDNYHVQAVGNLPLIKNKLALRATGYRFEESGFYRNVAGSDPTFQAEAAAFGAQAFATDADEVGASRFTGGRIAALFQASDALKFTLSYLKQKTETDGFALATTGTYDQTLFEIAPQDVARGQKGGLWDSDIDLANAMVEYDFGWANLLATYSYVNSGSTYSFPFSGIGLLAPLSTTAPSEHRAHSGEMRLTTQLDGAWNFLVGLYAEDLEDEHDGVYRWYGSPETNLFGTDELVGVEHSLRNLTQKAVFAEASWEFLSGFTLAGGVRAYDYGRTRRLNLSDPFFGGPAPISPVIATDASGTNFRGNLSRKLNDNALVYAGWSQGFRLGNPQTGLGVFGNCDVDNDGIVDGTNTTIESTTALESDNVDNFELGGKFTLLDRRLLIAADVYRMEWNGLPVRAVAPPPPVGCGIAYEANAGAARSEGIEFQANFYVTEAFRVDVGGSYVRARLTEDVPAQGWSAGDRLPGSPEVNANLGLQYEFKIGSSNAFVRADPIYVGTFYTFLGDELGPPRSGGYVKLDASARVELRHLNIDLFGRNLTNRDDLTQRQTPTAIGGYRLRPRTIGLQLSRDF